MLGSTRGQDQSQDQDQARETSKRLAGQDAIITIEGSPLQLFDFRST